MIITVNHQISNPENFWAAAQAALPLLPVPGVQRIIQALPNADGTQATCLWEADSIEALDGYLSGQVGNWSENTYFEVNAANAIGLSQQAPAPSAVQASVRAFLQGPMSGTEMTTTLNTKNLIPLNQPYNVVPFSYTGTESVPAIPADVTDWVLVELRNAGAPAEIVATRAAFLKKDGQIVDLDGTSPVSFPDVAAANYYIAVRHRNHLGIMTVGALACAPGITTGFDFTISASQTYGTNAQVNMNGRYAMWSGNVSKGTTASGKQAILNASSPSDVDQIKGAVTTAPGNPLHLSSFAGASVSNLYNVNDINLDGNIRYAASPSDVDLAKSNVLNAPGNVLQSPSYANLVEQLP